MQDLCCAIFLDGRVRGLGRGSDMPQERSMLKMRCAPPAAIAVEHSSRCPATRGLRTHLSNTCQRFFRGRRTNQPGRRFEAD
jgi:hypothetical protein